MGKIGGSGAEASWRTRSIAGVVADDLGTVYFVQGEKELAVRAMRDSLSLKRKVLGEDHPDVGVSEGNLAIALAEVGGYQDALAHMDRSLASLEKGLGAAHPELATQLSNQGEILNALKRYPEARRSFELAKNIWERELGFESRSLAYALTGIGVSFLGEGNPVDARGPLERAFKIRQAQEPDLTKKAETTFALARALWSSREDQARARALAESAKAAYEKAESKQKLSQVDDWLAAMEPIPFESTRARRRPRAAAAVRRLRNRERSEIVVRAADVGPGLHPRCGP